MASALKKATPTKDATGEAHSRNEIEDEDEDDDEDDWRVVNGPHFRCRGSRASRRPSPKKFRARRVTDMAITGNTSSHQ
jgi:hypothetical protein